MEDVNNMKTFYFFLIALSVSGCALFDTRIDSIVTGDDGSVMSVKSKSDAIVIFEEEGKKLTVDNRGRPGIIEQFLGAAVLRSSTRRTEVDEN